MLVRQVAGQGRVAGIEDVGRHPGLGVAAGAVGANLLQVDGQRVARFGAGHPKRAGLRVAARRNGDVARIEAAGVHGGGEHPITRFDGEHRIVRPEGVVKGGGNESMICHEVLLMWVMSSEVCPG